MASSFCTLLVFLVATFSFAVLAIESQLYPKFYDEICPKALPTIKSIVDQAIEQEPRIGASLLRLHFHDCFVNGCDGSILLDDTETFTGEKNAEPSKNSARGFEVIDRIKIAVDAACKDSVVSCADILAVAARDSVAALGGPSYEVLLGRRDSITASKNAANTNIPRQDFSFSALLANFHSHRLSMKDLVVLSGAHTLGFARCISFRNRLYNETKTIDANLAASLESKCHLSGDDVSLSPLDGSPTNFDTVYFDWLIIKKGLLHSDQQLYKGDGSGSDKLVEYYSSNHQAFWEDFGVSMVKMGNIKPLFGTYGEIRKDCRKVNA